jgi:hypothetical protein
VSLFQLPVDDIFDVLTIELQTVVVSVDSNVIDVVLIISDVKIVAKMNSLCVN